MGFLDWFKTREPKSGVDAVMMSGHEFHINPQDLNAISRNAARVQRLATILETETRPEKRAALEAELLQKRRFVE